MCNLLAWFASLSVAGGSEPWTVVFAQANGAAPEPSTLTLLGIAAACGIGYSVARKRKAAREAAARE
jgi:PEP-CTERM motif